MNQNYGFAPGDRLEVSWGEGEKKKSQIVTVVQEGTYEIRVDVGEYRAWIMKCDIRAGDLSIRKIEETDCSAGAAAAVCRDGGKETEHERNAEI